MGVLNKIKKLFEPCLHSWKFAGQGLGKSLVPEWIFKCELCSRKLWRAAGCFPTKESYDFYKEKMGNNFEEKWVVLGKEGNELQLIKNKQEILAGTYFNE